MNRNHRGRGGTDEKKVRSEFSCEEEQKKREKKQMEEQEKEIGKR